MRVIVVVGSVLLNVALAALGRGSFSHALAVISLIMCVAVPATLVGLLALAAAVGPQWPAAKGIARLAFGYAFVFGSTLISLPVGAALLERDVQAAKQFCEALIPRLEEHKMRQGEYPRDIESVGDLPEQPRLLRGRSFYFSDGSKYHFSFSDPSGMLNGYGYDRASKSWYKWD
jgi:hypothetical protein